MCLTQLLVPVRENEADRRNETLSPCHAYAVYTNGHWALLPNGNPSSQQQSQAVLNLEISRSLDLRLALLPCGRSTIWGWQHDEPLFKGKKKRQHVYNPRGYLLGAKDNCFPHFLKLVKLIHYQRQNVMPRAWQWVSLLWVFWHFLPCNSKQKAIKLVISLCIWMENAPRGCIHPLTWLKVSCLRCLPSFWPALFLLEQRDHCV